MKRSVALNEALYALYNYDRRLAINIKDGVMIKQSKGRGFWVTHDGHEFFLPTDGWDVEVVASVKIGQEFM